jgi:hypothetical protein
VAFQLRPRRPLFERRRLALDSLLYRASFCRPQSGNCGLAAADSAGSPRPNGCGCQPDQPCNARGGCAGEDFIDEARGLLAGVVVNLFLGWRVGLARIGSNRREIGRRAGRFLFSSILILLFLRFRGGLFFIWTSTGAGWGRRCRGARGPRSGEASFGEAETCSTFP